MKVANLSKNWEKILYFGGTYSLSLLQTIYYLYYSQFSFFQKLDTL